ncbi:L,D-transpeptidase family protein [Pelagibacterium luteolum]|uniref:Murein L,D-transpeptidase YafK n=1 Tax=Pelagibacterium luteolum TaxID=440168 RepID=A0A1G7Z427_9HYPH|nr:murein L,D-transpeptidase family protein [Pelagibacterium luteolum]SDH03501.1 Murein L,D-transpeptidase YafK [Pelagibacterium luteolum]
MNPARSIGRRRLLQAFAQSAALVGVTALAGCQTDVLSSVNAKANAPLPRRLRTRMAALNMDREAPILMRVFKVECELEVWKQDRAGKYALLKTYPVCKWSGDLGPKIVEGDRQTPEGFYDITPAQMNPNSEFFLSFNLGFPNAFDRAHGRTGTHLMVHGDCSSSGCYAMTDAQILEIYALAREAFAAGQRSFQVQAYPFRMTPDNLARRRDNPHLAYWQMLKEGNDHFEVTRLEPRVGVCEGRYVFNVVSPSSGPAAMNAGVQESCVDGGLTVNSARAIDEKRRKDDRRFNELVAQGVETAPVRSGRDGSMHPSFVAKLRPREITDEHGNLKLVVERGDAG